MEPRLAVDTNRLANCPVPPFDHVDVCFGRMVVAGKAVATKKTNAATLTYINERGEIAEDKP